ncbi:hypothetical protein DK254_08360 [Pseudomonas sp. RW407]|uniref:hypothetical protein n=1 Tax=Pseudomonas sp. RW407 TaxID=2202894 RepID=UPI000D6FCBE1|nr:hypothetical protein [Pseudomonas sp. RW407]PWU30125.1 hypothetical protein DK254_08360 [Pseudomonas sp. RW407]
MTEQQACTLCGAGGHTAAQCHWNSPGALESIRLPKHGTTIALEEMLAGYLPDDREYIRDVIEAYADIQARKAVMLYSGAGLAGRQSDACDWLENLEGDAWADACEEIAASVRQQAEGAQGEREAFEAWHRMQWPGGEPLKGRWMAWQARAALAQPSPVPELGCERCGGDCSGANPPVIGCPNQDEIQQALDEIDDFIARCNGDDRGSCGAVNLLRHALASRLSTAPELELERPEVVAFLNEWRDRDQGGIRVTPALSAMSEEGLQKEYGPQASVVRREPLMTIAQHKRIDAARLACVGILADEILKLSAERDAAQARLAAMEQQGPFCLLYRIDGDPVVQLVGDPHIKDGMALYAAPAAQPEKDK